MGSSTRAAAEDPERRRKDAVSRPKGTPKATLDDVEAAYSDDVERSPPGSLAQRGPADRNADGDAGRDGFLLRGVLAPLPFGSALGKTQ